MAVSSHPFINTPFALPAGEGVSSNLYGLPILPSLELAPIQYNSQPEHVFGPPPTIPEIDITNLSAEERSLLWNAPFPVVNHTGRDALDGMEFQSDNELAGLYLGAGSPMEIPPENSMFATTGFDTLSSNFDLHQNAHSNGDPNLAFTAVPPTQLAPTLSIAPDPSQPHTDIPRNPVTHPSQVRQTPAQRNRLAATTRTSSSFNPPSRTPSPFGIMSRAHSPFSPVSRAASPSGLALGRTSVTEGRRTSIPRVQQLATPPSRTQPRLADLRIAQPQQHLRAITPTGARAPTPVTPTVNRSRAGPVSALRATMSRSASIGPSPNYRPPSTPTAFGRPSHPRSASPRPSTQDRWAQSSTSQSLPQMRASPAPSSDTPLSTPCSGPYQNLPPLSPTPVAETRDNDSTVLTDRVPGDLNEEIPSEPFGWEDNATSQLGDANPPVQPHHVRTPPPASRIFHSAVISNQETDDPDDFLIDESELPVAPQLTRVNVVPGLNTSAPTVMEFRSKRADKIKEIGKGRKSKPSEGGGLVNKAKRIGDYAMEVQGVMSVMKASMLHTYVARAGFCEDDRVSFERAKAFAKEHMSSDVDTIVDDEFFRTMKSKFSQIRSTGTPQILERVQSFFGLEQGDAPTIEWLHYRDRFLYPGNDMERGDMFNTEIIGIVLDILYFGTGSRRIGVLFIDDMLKQDDPDEMERLFTIAALLGSDGEPEIPKIMDGSQYALRGLSIASIAFAAVHVHHALERLKLPEVERSLRRKKKQGGVLKKDFNDLNYNKLWMHYVRELAAHRNLGQLRLGFSDRIKKGYCRVWRRMSHPIGDDHMW